MNILNINSDNTKHSFYPFKFNTDKIAHFPAHFPSLNCMNLICPENDQYCLESHGNKTP